jgi:ABC-type transport system involved in multi-copper enzyme maturation permease subunit
MSRSPLQLAATVVGLAFLLAGIGGFIPGITTDASDIALYGHESPAKLLGIFQVSVLHNVIHLVFGLAGLVMARSAPRAYLVGGGLIYLVVWLYGLLISPMSNLNFVPLDDADNWLHLTLGAAMVLLGVVLSRPAVATTEP